MRSKERKRKTGTLDYFALLAMTGIVDYCFVIPLLAMTGDKRIEDKEYRNRDPESSSGGQKINH